MITLKQILFVITMIGIVIFIFHSMGFFNLENDIKPNKTK